MWRSILFVCRFLKTQRGKESLMARAKWDNPDTKCDKCGKAKCRHGPQEANNCKQALMMKA